MNNENLLSTLFYHSLFPNEKMELYRKEKVDLEVKISPYYISTLKKNVFGNHSKAFKNYLQIKNIDNEGFENKTNTPSWIFLLEKVMNSINIDSIISKHRTEEPPFYSLFSPFLEYLDSSLKESDELNYNVIKNLRISLYKALYEVSYLVFLEEFSCFKKRYNKKSNKENTNNYLYLQFQKEILSVKFETIFLKYPLLARKLATGTLLFISSIKKILGRLTKDKRKIENQFHVRLSRLKKIHVNAGDRHHGESTTILEFEGKVKVVYKPIAIDVSVAYNNLLVWVGQHLKENLKSFEILNQGNYGYIQFVEYSESKTQEDVATYYTKAGILAGIAYFLNTRDAHHENVIATENCPIIIDHETIIGTNLSKKVHVKNFNGTVLESYLLPSHNEKSYVICGFGSKFQKSSNIKVVHKMVNSNKDNMKIAAQIINQYKTLNNIPSLKGEFKYVENFQKEFIFGFNQLYKLILKEKHALIATGPPLNLFKNKKIRYLLRSTNTYAKLLSLLNKPEYLCDTTKYAVKLESLLAKAYLANNHLNKNLLNSELNQLLSGDIPVFYSNTSQRHSMKLKVETAGIFEKNCAIDSVIEKIKQASEEDREYQIGLIIEVLSTNKYKKPKQLGRV